MSGLVLTIYDIKRYYHFLSHGIVQNQLDNNTCNLKTPHGCFLTNDISKPCNMCKRFVLITTFYGFDVPKYCLCSFFYLKQFGGSLSI